MLKTAASKSTAQRKTLVQQVQCALPLLMQSIPEIKPAKEETEMRKQRQQLVQAIRGLQVIKRAVTTGTGADRLEFLQQEKYLDLLVMALKLDFDTSQEEADKVQHIVLDIISAHQLDNPQTDHVIILHENMLQALQQYFIRSVIRKQFKQIIKVIQIIYDSCFSNYNPRIVTYDSHFIFILQNVLNLQDTDYLNQEFEAQQCIKYAVAAILKLADTEELLLPLQFIYGQLLIKAVERNILDDEVILMICTIIKKLYCQENCIFKNELVHITHLVNLISDIDSQQVQDFVTGFSNLVKLNSGEEEL
ncbi:Conserved_hypothetical protein [Hexamita inflata]|uniref:Uncharacterized protein n=1 Tax=Hexamita inflata TaxID=28002 RepID=A0ABP1HU97_9EUKA